MKKGLSAPKTEWNRALVFIKPHACSDKKVCKRVCKRVKSFLTEKGVEILDEQEKTGQEMEKFIDNHYVLLSKSALHHHPKDIEVSEEKKRKFKERFREDWDKVIEEGRVHNAQKFSERFKHLKVGESWDASGTVKTAVAPGTVVGLLQDHKDGEDGTKHYVINGFYLDMREQFTKPHAKVVCFNVKFNENQISWKRFRDEIIGATNPEEALPGSLRRVLMEEYRDLGLKEKPNYGNNCIHASAGPIEALRERLIWYNTTIEEDPFAKEIIEASNGEMDAQSIIKLLDNEIIEADGGPTTTFDLTEGIDTSEAKRRILASPSLRSLASTVRSVTSMSSNY